MKKIILIASLLILLIIAAIATFGTSATENSDFRTTTITRGNISQVVTANGSLKPMEEVSVGTQVSGKIEKIYVKLNDEVKKGQLLAEIDPSIPETTLRQSRASLETTKNSYQLASRNLERTRALYAREFVARIELENAEQSYLSAKNALESIKIQVERDEVNLGYTKITSPIDGVIIAQEVSQGQTMAANFQTPNLFKIASDLSKMKIDVSFSEADISKVKDDMPVTFTVDAFPDKIFEGKVVTVNLNPNNQSGVVTYTVTVEVENKEKLLLPGMTAFVSVILSEQKDVLRVPAAALRFAPPEESKSGFSRLFSLGMRPPRGSRGEAEEAGQSIYLLKQGRPEQVFVTTGSTDETYVEISGDGIKEGDTVITGILPKRKR
ncbi:MAG: efflux RND transporter periplasmic adaptor subunit [Alphaproteobacteria bacterium]|nr:efflux RND transporter periplasmic adaptor subunit [Alphaproteobacteria bacterium]